MILFLYFMCFLMQVKVLNLYCDPKDSKNGANLIDESIAVVDCFDQEENFKYNAVNCLHTSKYFLETTTLTLSQTFYRFCKFVPSLTQRILPALQEYTAFP